MVVFTALSALIAATGNVTAQHRLAAAAGAVFTRQGVADTQNRMSELLRGIEYVQRLIDEELKRFRVGVIKTSQDTDIMDGFAKALRGDG